MRLDANDPSLLSWVDVPNHSDFPIQNLPFGVASSSNNEIFNASRIGDFAINLDACHQLGYLDELGWTRGIFAANSLNAIMGHGKEGIRALRHALSALFSIGGSHSRTGLKDHPEHHRRILVPISEVTMLLPVEIGDYTDFYSSKEHATNVGTMFRDPDNALLPNWLHLPVGYHGRSSSIVVSGTPVKRPLGQTRPDPEEAPVFGPSKLLDFELEMGFVTFDGPPLGESISAENAEDFIFGLTLFNDWSARDIQKWEYVPLGPFLAKNFASSMSAWIITLDTLEPFRVRGPEQNPTPLPYLQTNGAHSFDLQLEVDLITPENRATTICKSNFKHMYWSMAQQLAHHTVNGCNIRRGDLMASGTISGPTPDSYGSMLELSWRGTKPINLADGSSRKFIQDGDEVVIRGFNSKDNVRIGFGEVRGKVLPASL